jgi:2-methylisocitrate lyase-like PEP mutase family enzyme
MAQLEAISARFADVPLLYNMAASGKTPDLDNAAMARLGFRLAIFPNWLVLAAIPAMRRMLRELKAKGSVADIRTEVATFKDYTDIAGLPEVQALEERYGLPEDQRAGL